MTNNYYFSFLEKTEEVISGCEKNKKIEPLVDSTVFPDKAVSSKRLSTMLERTVENIDSELKKFENKFSNQKNIIYRAADFNEVFDRLKKIIKKQKFKTVSLPNVDNSTVFREIGIQYFIQENHLKIVDDADLQMYAPDLMLSDTGQLLLLRQSVNSLAKLNNSKCNIFFATIDQIAYDTSFVEIYQHLSSSSPVQEDMILYKGSGNCINYLFIIDNQRTNILHYKELHRAMTCIHCNRCSMVCPVFQTIGSEPYDNVFTGPLAHVTLPLLETVESYGHLAYACTLCGRCEEVCPVNIPIRDMILEQRHLFFPEKMIDKSQRRIAAVMKRYLASRKKMNSSVFLKRHILSKYMSVDYKKTHKQQKFASETFAKYYKEKLK